MCKTASNNPTLQALQTDALQRRTTPRRWWDAGPAMARPAVLLALPAVLAMHLLLGLQARALAGSIGLLSTNNHASIAAVDIACNSSCLPAADLLSSCSRQGPAAESNPC